MLVAIGAGVRGAGDMIREVTTGRLVALRDGHVRLIGVIAMLSGCFYVPSVNQRPGLEIRSSGAELLRGGSAEFQAVVVDPESDPVELDWQAYACGPVEDDADPADFGDCDELAFDTESAERFQVEMIPTIRMNGDVTRGIRVTLNGRDDRGAGAKPAQILALPVGNGRPTLQLVSGSKYDNTVFTPIDVYAAYSDPDDEAAGVTLTWEVFAPTEVPFGPIVDSPRVPPAPNPDQIQVGKRFTPTVEGQWQVRVKATDAALAEFEQVITIDVNPDVPPCIEQESPTISDGTTLPVLEPRLFSANVNDNLDIYPADSEDHPEQDPDQLIDPALFTWSLKVGTGPREVVTNADVQNSIGFDPAAYAVGTIVEIRVEIEDRIERTLTCPDGDAKCAVDSGSMCFQRKTWRVEAR